MTNRGAPRATWQEKETGGWRDTRGAGITVRLHMCRGNNRSAWRTAGGCEIMAERALKLLENKEGHET